MNEKEQYKITGTLHHVSDIQEFPSGFAKREFVVDTGGQYPQKIKLELFKEKCSLIENAKNGQEITAHFNIRGDEYNGKWYNNLLAWRIELGEANSTATAPAQQPAQEMTAEKLSNLEEIPF